MSFTTVAQVLQMQGGALIQIPKTVFMEKIKAAKSVSAKVDSILKSVMGGGGIPDLSQMFQNPMAAITSQLNGVAAQAATAATAALGGNAFSTALGGLQSAVSGLAGHAAGLSGNSMSGSFNFMDVVGHSNMVDQLGPELAGQFGMGLDTVLAPAVSGDLLATINSAVSTLQTQVLASSITPSAAAAIVATHTDMVQSIHDASVDALTSMQELTPVIAQISAAAATVMGASSKYAGNPALATFMDLIIQPDAMAAIKAAEAVTFPPLPAVPPDPSAIADDGSERSSIMIETPE
jgi:hypothetical protein